MTGDLFVNEVFGPTIQGEGRSQGLPVVFLRLGMCNLDCGWCDTPYTWDWTGKNGVPFDKSSEVHSRAVADIVKELAALTTYPARLVISGGEPMLQQGRLVPLLDSWPGPVEIETNATIVPLNEMWRAQFNCSPKLSNSGISEDRRLRPNALAHYATLTSTFKFVVCDLSDINEVTDIHHRYLADVEANRIYLMPEGVDRATIEAELPWVMNAAARLGYAVSPRLHVLAHGNKRGI